MCNFQGWSRKNNVEYPGVVLVWGLTISVGCNTVLWNFYGWSLNYFQVKLKSRLWYISGNFLWFFWMCPLPPFELQPQFSVKIKGLKIITYWASFGDKLYLYFSSFIFLNVFLPAETVVLGCSWVGFWPVMTCKMMHQIAYGFYLSINKCSKLG